MNRVFDAAVIGAGYVGCSVAYHLCAAGLKTVLIDRGPIAAGASKANFGNIQVLDAELDHSLDMIQAGYQRFARLEEELGYSVRLRKIGGLLLAENERQWRMMEERLRRLRAAGIEAELVPGARLAEVEPLLDPNSVLGGLYHPHEGQVDPFWLMWAYVRRAADLGLTLQLFTEVTGFASEHGRVGGVQTSQGDFHAGVVVLTTGAWTRQLGRLLGRNWEVGYIHGQACVTERIELGLRNHIASAAFFESQAGEEGGGAQAVLAMSQSTHGNVLLGEAMVSSADFRSHVGAAGLRGIARQTARCFPRLRHLRILRTWDAPVAFTADGLPLLGPAADLPGLILATAFRSTVIITPLVGEMVAQLVTQGRCDLDISHYRPERWR